MTKSLLLTGASSDVGMRLLREIASDYGTIYVQYRNRSEEFGRLIDDLSGITELIPIQADFSESGAAGSLIDHITEHGIVPCHVVHLPAPKMHQSRFHKEDWSDWEDGWEISIHSIVTILQAFLPSMAKARHGRIVFMLTSCTSGSPPKYLSGYVTVKYALLGLMKSLAVEYADKGITVNGISPDMMETKFLSELPHLVAEQNAANSPLGRNIRIEEVIPMFRYMLSDAGAAMTGENVVIRGGM